MSVEIISAIGNFRYHITPFWDYDTHIQKYKILETGDSFKTERGAIRKVKRIIKRKKKEYRESHPKYRCRTKPVVKRRRTKPAKKRNVWVQVNIG